jgi:glycosyltransferase involved in cell wall biosynthesis
LVVVGEGEASYTAGLHRLTGELGIAEAVTFVGHVAGPARLDHLRHADLFVLPSLQENFGIAVVEALAVGTPAVLSSEVALADAVSAADVGACVPVDAPAEAWAPTLDAWLARGRDTVVRARCREYARKLYDWERIAQRWLERYKGAGAA